jgi:hypothetical protein
MLGVVTECAIIQVGYLVAPRYPVHKISIAPFAQEMRRDSSCWGAVLGFRTIIGPVSSFGISFSTRPESPHKGTIDFAEAVHTHPFL